MIELIMFVGIGFLLACLLVIGVIPLVHARAVRLTTRRLEAMTPLSITEIQADKDQVRAEFAMTTRRLEMSVEQMKEKTTMQLEEIGKKSAAIWRLKLELGEKSAALFALEARERQLVDDLQSTQADLAAKATALEELERALASIEGTGGEMARRRGARQDVRAAVGLR
jgi:chromosome segregation ATPase